MPTCSTMMPECIILWTTAESLCCHGGGREKTSLIGKATGLERRRLSPTQQAGPVELVYHLVTHTYTSLQKSRNCREKKKKKKNPRIYDE